MTEYTIESAAITDAASISEAIITAITPELCMELVCDDTHDITDVRRMFKALAQRDDSQYSYRNTLVARSPQGDAVGILIRYDGASLYSLRKAFFEEYRRYLGKEIDEASIPDETDSDEIYIDTLAVDPKWRGKGIASALIEEASKRAQLTGKQLGLLVDKRNTNARRLYEKAGFMKVGERFFLNELMDHLKK